MSAGAKIVTRRRRQRDQVEAPADAELAEIVSGGAQGQRPRPDPPAWAGSALKRASWPSATASYACEEDDESAERVEGAGGPGCERAASGAEISQASSACSPNTSRGSSTRSRLVALAMAR